MLKQKKINLQLQRFHLRFVYIHQFLMKFQLLPFKTIKFKILITKIEIFTY